MKGFLKFTYVLIPIIAILVVGCETDDNSGGDSYNLNDIQGKWYRAYSNNPSADGMEVTASDNNGTITDPASSEFSLNSIKWKNIIAKGVKKYEFQDLHSNGSYYNAFMELDNDTLRISVGHTGAGNEQKWVRTYTEPVTELNECIPYEPGAGADFVQSDWSEANEKDFYPGLLPAVSDPAGGYYIVTLQSTSSMPWMEIVKQGDAVPVINGTPPSINDRIRTVAISAQYGVSYDVNVWPFINGAFPENYTISWEYVGIMDCYEPNDTFAEAKFIPKNQTIEAFANRNNEGYGVQEKFKDFYKVVLESPAKIQIELLQSPSDNFVNIRLYRENQSHIVCSTNAILGDPDTAQNGALYIETSNQVLDAGVYYIEVFPYWTTGHLKSNLDDGESLRDTWLTPYKFKVTTVE